MASFLNIGYLLLFLCFISNGYSKDLGVHGHLYTIQETDILEYLRNKLSSLDKNELEKIQKNIKDTYVRSLLQPKPLKLKSAKKYVKRYYNPEITVKNDIKDKEGNVIIAKGTHYNPLETHSLNDNLLIFDGNNPAHIDWAKSQKGKWILTSGRPLDLENSQNRPVYFDQFAYICERLGIQSIPSKVSQDGLKIIIEEIPIEVES